MSRGLWSPLPLYLALAAAAALALLGVVGLTVAETVDELPARALFFQRRWRPSEVMAAFLGLAAVVAAAGAALWLVVRAPWLLLRSWRGGGRYFHVMRFWRQTDSRLEALRVEALQLVGVLALGAVAALFAWVYGTSERLEADLRQDRFRRTAVYLGVLTVRDRSWGLGEVRAVRYHLGQRQDEDGRTRESHWLIVDLVDGSELQVSGRETHLRAAAALFTRALELRGGGQVERAGGQSPAGGGAAGGGAGGGRR